MPDYRETRKKELRRNMVEGGKQDPSYDDEFYEGGEDREQELRRHQSTRRRWRLRITVIAAVIILAVLAAVWLFVRYFKYTEYEESWNRQLGTGSYVAITGFGSNVIKCSHDGARYIGVSGADIWADSYEMKSPGMYVNGEYACIYGTGENLINIYNTAGKTGSAQTNLPVTKAVVSTSGVVAALVEDTSASYITFFSKDGTSIDITIKSLISGDGYPTDIALSPDGTQLMAAYEYLDGLEFKSRIVFYDFSEIGKNIPNRLVGGFEEAFENSFIGRVRFINSTYSYAAGDTGIYFFSSKNLASPELVKEVPIEEEILSVFNYKNHVGLITACESEEGTRRLMIYKQDGTQELDKIYSFDHSHLSTDGSYLYLYGSNRLMIMTLRGSVKYDGEFRGEPRFAVGGNLPGEYVVTFPSEIAEYKFR
jgi:hypothetical protein